MKYILKKTLSYFVLILFVTYGCTQDDFETVNDESKSINLSIANDSEQLQIEFGKVLAKGLYNSNELRLLIKTKALKQFNKDYDVLYHLIKDESLENGTVESYLSSFATSTAEYLEMVEQLPLLTIFVPSLPDFSAENWNVDEEIPQVAVRLQYDRNVPLYDYNENIDIIEANCIPAVPVVVVKLNERVKVREQGSLKSTAVDSPLAFEFIDDCYNPKNDNRLKGARWHPAITNDIRHGFDVVSGKAWSYYERSNHEMWQRDHVYYQMTDKITTGAYRNTYKEFITGIKLSNATGIPIFADQAPDQMFLDGAWTDGAFEFVINILINSKNGAGEIITKRFPVNITDLFDIEYSGKGTKRSIEKITPKWFNPRLAIVPWDLKSYGSAWKFTVSEYDVSEVVKREVSHTSEYSSNFSVNAEANFSIKKIGFKFGASQKYGETEKSTTNYTIQSTLASDEMGEAILTYDESIVLGLESRDFSGTRVQGLNVNTISTGWLELEVQPMPLDY